MSQSATHGPLVERLRDNGMPSDSSIHDLCAEAADTLELIVKMYNTLLQTVAETVASKDPLFEQRHEKQVEYSIHLQRIIEALCHGNTVPEACFAVATHHAEMAKEFTDAAKAHASVSATREPWKPGDPRVVCAAIRNGEGEIICGPRHFDQTMRRLIATSESDWRAAEQGFIDQRGEWLTREAALHIALANGQVLRRCGGDDHELFSENLY